MIDKKKRVENVSKTGEIRKRKDMITNSFLILIYSRILLIVPQLVFPDILPIQ